MNDVFRIYQSRPEFVQLLQIQLLHIQEETLRDGFHIRFRGSVRFPFRSEQSKGIHVSSEEEIFLDTVVQERDAFHLT